LGWQTELFLAKTVQRPRRYADHPAEVQDKQRAIKTGFDSRRELAIQVNDQHIIHRIKKTLEEDWSNSHPLDLSDAALLAELEDYDPNVKEDLAIGSGKLHKSK